MTQTAQLLARYRLQLGLPWPQHLSATERVWIAVYDPDEERRIRAALPDFSLATHGAQVEWAHIDLTRSFAHWIGAHPYRDDYFREPEFLAASMEGFEEHLQGELSRQLEVMAEKSVAAVTGAGSLFGLTRVSRVIEQVAPSVRGRMLLFFPGSLDGHNYRLLNARDGWNYHSVPLIPSP